MSPNQKRILRGFLVAVFWVSVWELLALHVNQVLLVPAPHTVAVTLFHLVQTTDFWLAVCFSLLRIMLGFFAGVIFGSGLAFLTHRFSFAASLLHPLRHGIRAIPVASFIILALVWTSTNSLPALISFLMVLPIMWSGVEQGLQQIDPLQLDMAQVFKLGYKNTLLQVRIPAILPHFRTAFVNSLGLAWKSGIAAEVICRPEDSIGRMLQEAKLYLETPEVFAWTTVVILLSLSIEKLLTVVVNRREKWRGAQ